MIFLLRGWGLGYGWMVRNPDVCRFRFSTAGNRAERFLGANFSSANLSQIALHSATSDAVRATCADDGVSVRVSLNGEISRPCPGSANDEPKRYNVAPLAFSPGHLDRAYPPTLLPARQRAVWSGVHWIVLQHGAPSAAESQLDQDLLPAPAMPLSRYAYHFVFATNPRHRILAGCVPG